jgi:hypothetical protein
VTDAQLTQPRKILECLSVDLVSHFVQWYRVPRVRESYPRFRGGTSASNRRGRQQRKPVVIGGSGDQEMGIQDIRF